MSRTAQRQVSFADWELVRQGLRLEPLLQGISDFLDDQKEMVEQVRCDLTRGLKKAETGRSGLTPQQVLRSLVLMRIKNWNYRELRERIADGCTLRQFTDFYCMPVPRHDAFNRGFNRLTPETLKASQTDSVSCQALSVSEPSLFLPRHRSIAVFVDHMLWKNWASGRGAAAGEQTSEVTASAIATPPPSRNHFSKSICSERGVGSQTPRSITFLPSKTR